MNVRPNSKAPASSADVQALVALLAIGQLAIDHSRAINAVDMAKHQYHDAIRDYECGEGHININGPDGEELKAATAIEYAAYLAAKRAAYNIKRRLDNACRKAVSQ